MAFVQQRTDQSKYSATDGVDVPFGTALEASAGGFGVRRTVKGKEVFEVLDALPLKRQVIQEAVEAGSAKTAAMVGPAAAGFTAVDFAAQDYVTAAEAAADTTDAITDDLVTSDLT